MFSENMKRYDAGWRLVGDLSKPKDNGDTVTKKYLETLIHVKLNSGYDFKKYLLQNICSPLDNGDVLNMKYAKLYLW